MSSEVESRSERAKQIIMTVDHTIDIQVKRE